MRRIISSLLYILIATSLGVSAPLSGAEKKQSEGAAPPQPVEATIKVKREVRTEIPLRIYGRRNEALKFLIRTPPEHGKLTDPHQRQQESATVIYDPPEDLSITHDKFLYAVQSSEGVSAAVEISITIIDAAPVLVIADPVEFPKIMAGKTAMKTIELSNHGGGLATGELIVSEPWKIDGSLAYRIGAGEKAAFKLVFAPQEGGVFDGSVSYTSDREHSTLIRGEAIPPLSVSPEKISLANAEDDPIRTGSFVISNQTDQAQTLQIRGGDRLQTPEKVEVPPHDKVSVPIRTLASDVAPIDAEIRLESAGFSIGVPVKSPAVGPILRVSSTNVDFGKQPAARPASGSVEIENIGGLQGTASFEVAAPFVVDPISAVVQAGRKKTARINLPPSRPGVYRTWLKVTAGRQELEVGVQAELLASGGAPQIVASTTTPASGTNGASGSSRANGTGAADPTTGTLRAEPISPTETESRILAPSMPTNWGTGNPGGATVLGTTPESATLSWPDNLSSATRFRFELRHMGLDASRHLAVTWIEHNPVTVKHENGRYVATLGELKPMRVWAVQILPLDADGAPGPRLFAIDFTTPEAPPSVPQVSVIQWLLLALAICFGVVVWRYVRRPHSGF